MMQKKQTKRRYAAIGLSGLVVCVLILASCSVTPVQTGSIEIIVSPDGEPNGQGTVQSPMRFDAAIARASMLLKSGKVGPADSLTITLLGGVYPFTETIELGKEFAGSPDTPIVIQAAKDAEVIFDGRVNVAGPEEFKPVTDARERQRLAESARDNIVVKTLDNPALIAALSDKLVLSLGIDNGQYLPAVYPNEGFAMLDTTPVVKEPSPPGVPKDKQGYGVRGGQPPFRDMSQPAGWLGTLEEPRGAEAGIVQRADEMAGTWSQWEAELKRDNTRNNFTGFYEAIWKLSSMPIYAVNAEQKTLHLSQAFSYGFGWLKTQPFRVFGLLCELDRPGEWYFDTKTNRLYIYPVTPFTKDTKIGLPVANGFMTLKDCAWVNVVGIHIRNVGSGTVFNIDGGTQNLVAGCSITNSTAAGAMITGTYNGAKSCDFVDLNLHVTLSGGTRSPQEITGAHNVVENCHFYHKNFKHEKVNIVMEGVGNVFRNNLIHNSIGQAMIVYGNDQTVELNEVFNVGYEEGDGGAIYSGADLTGYGNLYRFNFIHHLMRTPDKKLGRNGLFLDDFQAGATCIGNIFYKSCNNGICMNDGPGHTLIGNLFLAGNTGIYQRGNWGEKALERTTGIAQNPNHNYAGLKEDYIGRAEQIVGPKGWLKDPWASKYPLFKKVMSDEGRFGRLWPIYCTFKNNIYFENKYNQVYLYRCPQEAKDKMVLENDIQADKSFFKDYDHMNFTLVKPVEGVEDIPFDRIGLYLDAYRTQMPDKNHYRMTLKNYFADDLSYEACYKTIDTAKVIEEGPMVTAEKVKLKK